MQNLDLEEDTIRESNGKIIASFNAFDIEMNYKLSKEEVFLHVDWLRNFKILPNKILKKWWSNKGIFKTKANRECPVNMLKTKF